MGKCKRNTKEDVHDVLMREYGSIAVKSLFIFITKDASYELYRYTYDRYAGKSIYMIKSDWNEVFIKACGRKSNSEDGIQILTHLRSEQKVDLKAKDEDNHNMTALHLACQSGHPRIVEYLMEECPELARMKNSLNALPLHLCSVYFTHHTFRKIEILLNDDALTQSMTDEDWYRNISNAVQYGVYELYVFWIYYFRSHQTLSYLLQPENMHAYRDSKGLSLLHFACIGYFRIKDRLRIIDDLIDTFGFPLTLESDSRFYNRQCIHFASQSSHPSIVYALLLRDPELAEVMDANGSNTTHVCVYKYHKIKKR